MVWGNTESDEAKGHGQGFVHVDFGIGNQGHDAVRGVEASGAGADDGHAEGPVMAGRGCMGQAAEGRQPCRLRGGTSDTAAGQDTRTTRRGNEASTLAGMARVHGIMAGRLVEVVWRAGRTLYGMESGGPKLVEGRRRKGRKIHSARARSPEGHGQ